MLSSLTFTKATALPENKKSVAYSLVLRAEDRTLTDDECSDVVGKVIKALSEIGAELRA